MGKEKSRLAFLIPFQEKGIRQRGRTLEPENLALRELQN